MEQIWTDEEEIQENNPEGFIELNPDDVINRSGKYSALTDLYSISLFSSEFEKLEKRLEQKEADEMNTIVKNIFENEKIVSANEEIFLTVINSEESKIIRDSNTNNRNNEDSITGIIILIIIILLTSIGMLQFEKRNEKKSKENEKNDNLEHYDIKF